MLGQLTRYLTGFKVWVVRWFTCTAALAGAEAVAGAHSWGSVRDVAA